MQQKLEHFAIFHVKKKSVATNSNRTSIHRINYSPPYNEYQCLPSNVEVSPGFLHTVPVLFDLE